ncbi:hypothetical protein D3C76_1854350 [compost metagenome]
MPDGSCNLYIQSILIFVSFHQNLRFSADDTSQRIYGFVHELFHLFNTLDKNMYMEDAGTSHFV